MHIWAGSNLARRSLTAALLLLATGTHALARDSGDPIALRWMESDVSGFSNILSPDGKKVIGTIDFHQERKGDVIDAVRVARFADGSSDEDRATARVGKTLVTLRGRSIIRDTKGRVTVDITIDVEKGRITGFSGLGKDRKEYDEKEDLPGATYFGPLVFIAIKNFAGNAEDGRLVFRTVVPTPSPRVIDMEVLPMEAATVSRPGIKIPTTRYALRPTVNVLIDPIIRMIAPETSFFVDKGEPPSLARFAGPRNYAGQEIRIE